MTNLSRRRYAELTVFLKSVVINSRISIRTRMQAAARLDGILERNEAQTEREQVRREARERAALNAASSNIAPSAPAIPLTPEELHHLAEEERDARNQAVFARVLRGHGGDDAD